MRLAQDSFETINILVDRYTKRVPDVDNEKVKEKLMRALTDLVCMHLGYEIEVRNDNKSPFDW